MIENEEHSFFATMQATMQFTSSVLCTFLTPAQLMILRAKVSSGLASRVFMRFLFCKSIIFKLKDKMYILKCKKFSELIH